jgi:hypothetical protein
MSFDILAIDVNNQHRGHVGILEKLTQMHQPSHLIIAGIQQRIRPWTHISAPKTINQIIVSPASEKEGATTIRLSVEIMKTLQELGNRRALMLIATHPAYEELTHNLIGMGHEPVRAYQLAKDMAFADDEEFQTIREELIAIFLEKKKGVKFVRADEFLEHASEVYPQLKDPAMRRRLFGTTKLKGILKRIGLISTQGRVTGCRFTESLPTHRRA